MKRSISLIFLLFFFFFCQQTISLNSAIITDWHYEIMASTAAKELTIEASFPPGISSELSVNTGSEPFIRNVEIAEGRTWRRLPTRDGSWFTPTMAKQRGCRIRYRYLLEEAAHNLNDRDIATSHGEALLSPPSAWLLRPLSGANRQRVSFRVTTPEGISFVTGVFPINNKKDSYETVATNIPGLPYSAFGPLRIRHIELPGTTIEVAFTPGKTDLPETAILEWISSAARGVASYYGQFPIRRALVIVRPGRGDRIGYGSTLGSGGAAIMISVGRTATLRDLEKDWVMTHEMVHFGFPCVPRARHAWMEEGTATYIEPLARLQIGKITEEDLWREWIENMPEGLPQAGDKGLDYTPTWGRTYWGGALFCLLADIEIRERTANRSSLADAMRGIVTAGGNVAVNWELSHALAEGDKATGVDVLTKLYQRMRATPVNIDLPALWKRLGVELRGHRVIFNDRAPLAAVRRAITAKPIAPTNGNGREINQ